MSRAASLALFLFITAMWFFFIAIAIAIHPANAAGLPANTTIVGCAYFATPPTIGDAQYATIRCDSTGALVVSGSMTTGSSASMATSQVTVTGSATLIMAARAGRNSATIINNSTTPVYIGNVGVTTGNGVKIAGQDGASLTLPFSGAIYGISGGSAAISAVETY